MNRPFYPTTTSTSTTTTTTITSNLSQAPPSKPLIHERFHSRNTSDPQDYHRRSSIPPPPPPPQSSNRYDDDDTEDADEDEEMAVYSSRPGPNATGSTGSRPGSSSKDSGSAPKKAKTKSTKIFQCTGYGDCTMQFTRSEHLARHIR